MKNNRNNIIANLLNQWVVKLDAKTLNTNLTGLSFFKELATIASSRYIKNKKLISKIGGYLVSGQEYFLLKKSYDQPRDAVIVEIGSYKGKSTVCLGLGCLGSNKKIYAIDTFKGNDSDFYNFKSGKKYTKGFLSTFKNNLRKAGVLDRVNIIKGNSQNVGKKWQVAIDMLFIDASHEYVDVLKDYRLFYPYVKKGGLIIFHDVLPEFPGVLRVWKDVAKKQLKRTHNFLSFGYGYK